MAPSLDKTGKTHSTSSSFPSRANCLHTYQDGAARLRIQVFSPLILMSCRVSGNIFPVQKKSPTVKHILRRTESQLGHEWGQKEGEQVSPKKRKDRDYQKNGTLRSSKRKVIVEEGPVSENLTAKCGKDSWVPDMTIVHELTQKLKLANDGDVSAGEGHEILYERGHAYLRLSCDTSGSWQVNDPSLLAKALADFHAASMIYYYGGKEKKG